MEPSLFVIKEKAGPELALLFCICHPGWFKTPHCWRASAVLMRLSMRPVPLSVVPTVMTIINGVTVMVSLPVLRMAGRHVRVNRTGVNHGGGPVNNHGRRPDHDRMSVDDRVRVNGRRREIADVQVKARLADADGHAHIGCICCGCSDKDDHHGD